MQEVHTTLPTGATVRDTDGGRYVVEGLLGEGGFGAVYLVRDWRNRQNMFALKEVVNPKERDRERFIFEGELLKRLDHQALPHVYKVFEDTKLKRVYLLMDYIQGRDLEALREEQSEQRFSLPIVLGLLAPIMDAIKYLHHQDPPIVHRDIKPANIIVPVHANSAMLVDFGSAKEHLVDATTNMMVRPGSPGYAALEQYGGGTAPQTDIYGLGATFYTLLTGRIPLDAISRAGSSRFDPLEPAHLVVPDVSWAVATAIERAMSISLEDRFETVEEFWQEVTQHAPEEEMQTFPRILVATPIPPALLEPRHETSTPAHQLQSVSRGSRRVMLLRMALIVLLILVMGAGSLAYVLWHAQAPGRVDVRQSSTVTPTINQAPQIHRGATPTSAVPTVPAGSLLYPHMAGSYAGTVVDLMNSEKSPMFLTQMQQNQGSIQGDFQGLGLVGTFTGKVTTDDRIHFIVKVTTADVTLAFEGNIKVGGDMVGTFDVLDHNGSRTGESGLWNLAASPSQ